MKTPLKYFPKDLDINGVFPLKFQYLCDPSRLFLCFFHSSLFFQIVVPGEKISSPLPLHAASEDD